jgi:hypothetical protein
MDSIFIFFFDRIYRIFRIFFSRLSCLPATEYVKRRRRDESLETPIAFGE